MEHSSPAPVHGTGLAEYFGRLVGILKGQLIGDGRCDPHHCAACVVQASRIVVPYALEIVAAPLKLGDLCRVGPGMLRSGWKPG